MHSKPIIRTKWMCRFSSIFNLIKITTWIIINLSATFATSLIYLSTAHAEVLKPIPIAYESNRPPKRCSADTRHPVLENLFSKIYQGNKDVFDKAQVARNSLCFKVIAAPKGRPAAFAVSATGEVTVSSNLLEPEVSEQVLAFIFAHELAHILLDHSNPDLGNLPYSYKKHLREDQPGTAKRYEELQEQLLNSRAYRGAVVDPFQSDFYRHLHLLPSNVAELFQSIMPSAHFTRGGAFSTEPHYVAESKYNEIFRLSESSALKDLPESFKHSISSTKEYHLQVQEILAEMAAVEEKLRQKGVQVDGKASIRQLTESEADEVGMKLFLNSGFTEVFDGLIYLSEAYFKSHKNYGGMMNYCHWLEGQKQLHLDSNNSAPQLCLRFKAMRDQLNNLVQNGYIGPAFKDFMKPVTLVKKARFSLAALSKCSGAPIKMPGASMQDKVLILTSGHCIDGQGEVRFKPQVNLVTLKKDFSDGGYNIITDQVILKTQRGLDLGLLQSIITYEELYKKGYYANDLGQSFLSKDQNILFNSLRYQSESRMLCQVEELVPRIEEGPVVSENVFRLKKSPTCNFQPGDSGSVAIGTDGKIYGVAQTIYEGGKPCSSDNPCEKSAQGSVVNPGQLYVSPVVALNSCYNMAKKQFDFDSNGCPLR